MKIVVLGTGYVGSTYLRMLHYLGFHPLVLSRAWCDYRKASDLSFTLKSYQAQVVINAAGYIGRNVDDCEANKKQCWEANVASACMAAKVCRELQIPFLHVSSGCIFDGAGPFDESSEPNMSGQFYASCKLMAEQEIVALGGRIWIFRIRMPFSNVPHPRNWLVKLALYPQILDGLNSVTWLDEFAMRSWQLLAKSEPGVYHAVQPQPVYTAEVAAMLLEAGLRSAPVVVGSLGPEHVRRSAAVLNAGKFEEAYGSPFTGTLLALRLCIGGLSEIGLTGQGLPVKSLAV